MTNEPERALHRRVDLLLKIHNDAVTSMRYPQKKSLKAKDGDDKDKSQADLEDELAELLADEDDDDF